jgi:hypothetical protein
MKTLSTLFGVAQLRKIFGGMVQGFSKRVISWEHPFSNCLSISLTGCAMKTLMLMAFLVQRIWFRRNKIVFDKKWVNPSTVAQEAKAGLDAFQASNFSLPSREEEVGVVVSPKGWQPPFPGSIKINWDAYINKALGCIGIGVVARDYQGKVLGAKCSYQKQSLEPDVAEMFVALDAVVFCKEAGFWKEML